MYIKLDIDIATLKKNKLFNQKCHVKCMKPITVYVFSLFYFFCTQNSSISQTWYKITRTVFILGYACTLKCTAGSRNLLDLQSIRIAMLMWTIEQSWVELFRYTCTHTNMWKISIVIHCYKHYHVTINWLLSWYIASSAISINAYMYVEIS